MIRKRHGLWGASEYWSWAMMKQRCQNKNYTQYDRYGGRGIRVCNDWRDFTKFYSDMGPKPSPEHSIDRIDNNGNYEPSNCRWASKLEQVQNRGINKNNTSGYKGVARRGGRWRAYVMKSRVQINLGTFDTANEAARARKSYDLSNQR